MATVTLIGEGRIAKAVAENRCSLLQEGSNDLIDMLSPCCLVEKKLAPRGHLIVVGVEKNLSDLLSYG
jgi:hypothetical protein